jgi:Kelch motif
LLPDGRVLVAGGNTTGGRSALNSAEIYDPSTGTWTPAPSLAVARFRHSATLLLDGRVLVVAGLNSSLQVLRSAELYDPATNTWTSTADLRNGRATFTATLLATGKVLVAGGEGGPVKSSELFNPVSATWTFSGSLVTARSGHTANLLPDGEILIAGGYGEESLARNSRPSSPEFVDHGALASAELGLRSP